MPTETMIACEALTKRFGHFTAVDQVSFAVAKGSIFGFLGPNGSGKSTVIRMLCGLLEPSDGRASIAGFDVAQQTEEIKPLIGYMSQNFSLYDELTVHENLNFYGRLYGLHGAALKQRYEELIGLTQLADAQRIYSNTSWYWARTKARLTNLADLFTTFDQPKLGAQISMVSTNRTRILDTELVPRSGLLSWRGQEQLRRVAGVTEPFYSVSRGGPKLQLVGFCTERIFRVEAEGPSDGSTLSDVIMVATNAWHSIQSASKDTP